MKRYTYPIFGLLFASLMLMYLWLSPVDTLDLKLVSETGNQEIMNKLNVQTYLIDEDAESQEPYHYGMFIDGSTGQMDYSNLFDNRNRKNFAQSVMSQFPLWHRPSRKNQFQVYDDAKQSLWLDQSYSFDQARLTYSIINKESEDFKDYEYPLESVTKDFQEYKLGGVLGTENEYKVLLLLENKNEAKPAKNRKQKLVVVTINQSSGEVIDEKEVFAPKMDYLVSFLSHSDFNPNYILLRSTMTDEMTESPNRSQVSNNYLLYDDQLEIISSFELPKIVDQTNNWLWVDGDQVFLLTNGLLGGRDDIASYNQKPEDFSEINLFRLNIGSGKFEKEKTFEGEFASIKVFQGSIYFAEKISKNQRKINVYQPKSQTMVYQGLWEASSPKNHEVSFLGFDLINY